jgi:diguanylate cyclase (GGDEF) domain
MEKHGWWQTTAQVQHRMQQSQLTRLFFTGVACAALGAAGMGIFRYYWIMAILIAALLSMFLGLFLLTRRLISDETAGVIPMVILCFVYTPAIWFTFDGLMGVTPYQAILFITVILLSYYKKTQEILLTLYLALLCGLSIQWFWQYHGKPPYPHAWGTMVTFVLTVALTILLLQKSKERHMEISREIIDRSNQDALTGLYNRSAIEPILERAEQRYQSVAENYILLVLDIDDFKQINDTYGHSVGDAVLKSVAANLSASVRERDYVSRYGGDEFLIVITIERMDDANAILARINSSVCCVSDFAFDVFVSVGGAHRKESDSKDALIALADQRMYETKNRRAQQRHHEAGNPADASENSESDIIS